MNYVIDTSALVALSGIDRLDLLQACCGRVAIPVAVRTEVVDQGWGWVAAGAAQAEIRRGEWITTLEARESPMLRMLRAKLGRGEAECIELARVLAVQLIADDQAARREAARMGIAVVGSLGILALSRERGLVERVGPLVQGMRNNGIFFSNSLIERFLFSLGESP